MENGGDKISFVSAVIVAGLASALIGVIGFML